MYSASRVEGVAGGGVERIGEVVDELDLARQCAFDPVAGPIGALERRGRAAGASGARVELGLHLPLHAVLGAGLRARPRGRRR